jgi:hypothetical protein
MMQFNRMKITGVPLAPEEDALLEGSLNEEVRSSITKQERGSPRDPKMNKRTESPVLPAHYEQHRSESPPQYKRTKSPVLRTGSITGVSLHHNNNNRY